MLHMLDCLALCLAPHVIYYFATELSEYDALASASYGAISYFFTAIVKGMLTALYTPAGSEILWLRIAVAAVISLTDVVGLWYAIVKFSHRNISNSHKFQAIGLGWAAADALMMRTFPILSGAWSAEFNTAHVLSAVQANIFIVHMLSMAALGVLFWGKKSKPASVLAALRSLVLIHAVAPAVISVLEQLHLVSLEQAVLVQAVSTAALTTVSIGLWQQCNAKPS